MKTKAEHLPKQYLNDPAGGKYAKCFLIRGLEETPEGKRNKWHVIGYVGKRGTEGDTMPWISHRPEDKAGLSASGRLKDAQEKLADLWEAQQPKDGVVTVPGERMVCRNAFNHGPVERAENFGIQQAESRQHRVGSSPVTYFDVAKQSDDSDAEVYVESVRSRVSELRGKARNDNAEIIAPLLEEIRKAFLKARQTAR